MPSSHEKASSPAFSNRVYRNRFQLSLGLQIGVRFGSFVCLTPLIMLPKYLHRLKDLRGVVVVSLRVWKAFGRPG